MELLEILLELLAKKSVTPNDNGCQDFIAKILASHGFEIIRSNFNNTSNLMAIKGNTNAPALVLLGHTDVVPAGQNWQTSPFEPTIIENKIFARGAVDMKAAVACMVKAACELKTNNRRIAIMLTSDEEGNGKDGIFRVLDNWNKIIGPIKACLVGEPTSNITLGDTIKLGRRGSINGVIDIVGKQGHAAYPELAINPISSSMQLINLLEQQNWDEVTDLDFPATKLVFTGIDSGNNTCNMIPGSTRLYFNIRFNPGTSSDAIKNKIEIIANQNNIKLTWNSWQPSNGGPYKSNPGILTEILKSTIKSIMGISPNYSYDGGTSDGRFLAKYCSEVVEFGALRQTAHKADEHISKQDLHNLYQIYLKSCEQFLLNS